MDMWSEVSRHITVEGPVWRAYAETGVPGVMGFSGYLEFDTEEEAKEALPDIEQVVRDKMERWLSGD